MPEVGGTVKYFAEDEFGTNVSNPLSQPIVQTCRKCNRQVRIVVVATLSSHVERVYAEFAD